MPVWLCTRLSDAGASGQGTPGTRFSIPLLRWQELPCQEPHGALGAHRDLGEAGVATKGHHRAALLHAHGQSSVHWLRRNPPR